METELEVGLTQVFVHHWLPASPITHQVTRSLKWCEAVIPLGVVCPENPQAPLISATGTSTWEPHSEGDFPERNPGQRNGGQAGYPETECL